MQFWQEFGVISTGILAFLGIVTILGKAIWSIWLRIDERLEAIDEKLDAHLEWHEPIVPRRQRERQRNNDQRNHPR